MSAVHNSDDSTAAGLSELPKRLVKFPSLHCYRPLLGFTEKNLPEFTENTLAEVEEVHPAKPVQLITVLCHVCFHLSASRAGEIGNELLAHLNSTLNKEKVNCSNLVKSIAYAL